MSAATSSAKSAESGASSWAPSSEKPFIEKFLVYDVDVAKKVGSEIFRYPEQLDQLDKQRKILHAKKLALDAQLKAAVQSSLDDAKSALGNLDSSKALVSGIRKNFIQIDDLCVQSSDLIKEYELIKEVNRVRTNLTLTKREIQKMSDIPKKVEEIQKLLQSESTYLQAYEELSRLEVLRVLSLRQAKEIGEHMEAALAEEFRSVEEVWRTLEQKIFGLMVDAAAVAKRNPEVVVSVMRIIEREDRSEENPRGYLGTLFETLQHSVTSRWQKALGALEPQAVEENLRVAESLLRDVTDVQAHLAPCCPPRYSIVNFFVGRYHQNMHARLQTMAQSEAITIGEILALVRWVQEVYEPYLTKLRVTNLQPPLMDSLAELTSAYRSHLHSLMHAWTERVVLGDQKADPHIIGDIYYSQAPLHLFTFLNQQIEVVDSTGHKPLKLEVALECGLVIQYYQTLFLNMLNDSQQALDFEYLMALSNNSMLAYQYLMEFFQGKMGFILEQNNRMPNLDEMNEGFETAGHVALKRIADKIETDLSKVWPSFFTKEWYDATPPFIQQVCGTIKDYIVANLLPHLLSSNFRELVSELLDRVVQRYLAALLSKKRSAPSFSQATTARMQLDINAVKDLFGEYIREKVLDVSVEVLTSVWKILASDLPVVPVHFDSLLENYPDATVNVVEFLLENRSDVDKKEMAAVLQQCQEIWSRRHGGAEPVSTAPAGQVFAANLPPMAAEEPTALKHMLKKKKKYFTELLHQVVDLS